MPDNWLIFSKDKSNDATMLADYLSVQHNTTQHIQVVEIDEKKQQTNGFVQGHIDLFIQTHMDGRTDGWIGR